MSEKLTVYARRNRAKKFGTTYHLYRGSCPMIKNKPDIEAVDFDEYVKDMKERKKDFTQCKACARISEQKEVEEKAKADKKAEKEAKKAEKEAEKEAKKKEKESASA